MLTLLIFSFLAGFITILAPCIWPLLPIVFSASSNGGKRKSLGITLGVMASFTIFTLFISYIVKIFPINPNSLRLVATVIIGYGVLRNEPNRGPLPKSDKKDKVQSNSLILKNFALSLSKKN